MFTKGELDYMPIRSQFFEMERVLTNAARSACIDVTIRMDNVYEDTEEFSIELLFAEPSGGFFVAPDITTVTIMDTTGECIRCMAYLTVWTIISNCRVDYWFHWSTLSSHGEHGTNDIHCWCDWRYSV